MVNGKIETPGDPEKKQSRFFLLVSAFNYQLLFFCSGDDGLLPSVPSDVCHVLFLRPHGSFDDRSAEQ